MPGSRYSESASHQKWQVARPDDLQTPPVSVATPGAVFDSITCLRDRVPASSASGARIPIDGNVPSNCDFPMLWTSSIQVQIERPIQLQLLLRSRAASDNGPVTANEAMTLEAAESFVARPSRRHGVARRAITESLLRFLRFCWPRRGRLSAETRSPGTGTPAVSLHRECLADRGHGGSIRDVCSQLLAKRVVVAVRDARGLDPRGEQPRCRVRPRKGDEIVPRFYA